MPEANTAPANSSTAAMDRKAIAFCIAVNSLLVTSELLVTEQGGCQRISRTSETAIGPGLASRDSPSKSKRIANVSVFTTRYLQGFPDAGVESPFFRETCILGSRSMHLMKRHLLALSLVSL